LLAILADLSQGCFFLLLIHRALTVDFSIAYRILACQKT